MLLTFVFVCAMQSSLAISSYAYEYDLEKTFNAGLIMPEFMSDMIFDQPLMDINHLLGSRRLERASSSVGICPREYKAFALTNMDSSEDEKKSRVLCLICEKKCHKFTSPIPSTTSIKTTTTSTTKKTTTKKPSPNKLGNLISCIGL